VLAIRADFYGRCAAYPGLSRLLGANHVLVGPMARDELRRAIERPAERVGLTVEPELADALVADVESQPGALPLLSTALLELWRERDGRRLRVGAYARSGGVQGAVARLAEDAFVALDAEEQGAARALLLRLTDEDESGAIVRRRIELSELDPATAGVAAELTDRRLLTVSEGTVEVAHEALLREWPRLRGWLDEDVQGRRLHRQLAGAARAWNADARDPGELYRGARLASALDWAADHAPELNGVERDFLALSRAASERATRRLRLVIAGMACLLVLALGAGAIALNERRNALDESVSAAAQRLDAQALLDAEPDRAALLARQAVAMDDSVHTRGNLLAALLKNPAAIGVLRRPEGRAFDFDLSSDARTLAVLDGDGELRFVDAATRRDTGPSYAALGHDLYGGRVTYDDVRFSPDGSRVAVGGDAPAIVDARSHRLLSGLRVRRDRIVYSLRFSPDGRTVFVVLGSIPQLTPGMEIQRFDAAGGEPLGPARPIADQLETVSLMVSGDGRRVVTSSPAGGTVIRDARTLQPLRRLPVNAQAATLGADGRTLLAGGSDGSVRFVDLQTGELRRAGVAHTGGVADAVFTADGRRAVTAGTDGRAIVWDVKRASALETLTANAGGLVGLVLSRDSATLYTSDRDGVVLAWDIAGSRRLDGPFDIPRAAPNFGLPAFALSPDGRSLAIAGPDAAVSVWDLGTLRRSARFPGGPVAAMSFLPDGRLLGISRLDGRLALVDPRTGVPVTQFRRRHAPVWMLAFNADGHVMATAEDDGAIRRWSLPSGRPIGRPFKSPASTFGMLLDSGARWLAVNSGTGVAVFDLAIGKRLRSLPGVQAGDKWLGFTADRRYLVAKRSNTRLRLWSTDTWKPVDVRLGAGVGDVATIALSPDGSMIATSSADGTTRIWDRAGGRPLGSSLPGLVKGPTFIDFTPDGAYLIVITNTGRAFRWDVRPSSWARHACLLAGRRLTRAEWSAALPGRDYAPAC